VKRTVHRRPLATLVAPSALGSLLILGSGCDAADPRAAAVETSTSSLVTATASYKANDQFLWFERPTCGTTKKILIKEPESAGTYPVFMFLWGTGGIYDTGSPQAIISEAARQGFVAAAVDYQHATLPKACTSNENGWYKARCTFSPTFNPQTAVNVICARSKADCNGKGIVVAGFSQGGALAALARNFDARVRGVWAMGFSDRHWDGTHQPCLDEGTGPLGSTSVRLLKNDRLRIVRGGNEGSDIGWMNQTTGRSCASTAHSCLTGPNGSGWYLAQASELDSARNPNRHCFMQVNPLDANGNKVDCKDVNVIDPVFGALPPASTFPSGMFENIGWLKNTILPLGNQP
jgi:hypothetical protein